MIRIFGTITDPTGQPVPGAFIELRALQSTSEVLMGSTVSVKCNHDGYYDFALAIGVYDAYAQNDACNDMDYLGTAVVADDSADGDIHHILVDGGITLTPPMLMEASHAMIAAQEAATLARSDREQTERHASATKKDSQNALLSASTAKDAAKSTQHDAAIVGNHAQTVTEMAQQVGDDSRAVAYDKAEVVRIGMNVSDAKRDISAIHSDLLSKTEQASLDAKLAQSANQSAVSAADTASQKALATAIHEATALVAANRAESAAKAVTGALIDAGSYDAASGVLPEPLVTFGVTRSCFWKVVGAGLVSGIDFGINDSLVYTATSNSYYKIDNTESVTKVCGKTGIVDLNAADVGAEPKGAIAEHQRDTAAHDLANADRDGFMSAADKKKLDSVAMNATALELGITASAAAAGNHVHSGTLSNPISLSTQDLDTLIEPNVYAQHANANTSAARHYPENLAGSLTVSSGAGVQQRYHVYNTSRVWTRAKYSSGGWTPWARDYNTLNKPTPEDIGAMRDGGTYSTIYLSNWIRTTGACGWYSETYGGGWHMNDTAWLRAYNGKKVYVASADADAFNTAGGVYAGGNGNFNDVYIRSDERLKSDFTPIENPLDKLLTLNGLTYTKAGQREAGLIAQQVAKVQPESVYLNEDGYLSLANAGLVALIVEAIKELSSKLETLNGSAK